jgi:hypothetical protein
MDGTVGAQEEQTLLNGLSKLDDMLDGMRMKSLGTKADKVTPPPIQAGQRVIGQQQAFAQAAGGGAAQRQKKKLKATNRSSQMQHQQRGPGGEQQQHFVQMGNSPQMMPVYPMQQQHMGVPQHAMMQQQSPHMMQAGQGHPQFVPMMQPQGMQQAYLHYGGPAMHSYALQPPGNFVSPTISPTAMAAAAAAGGGGGVRGGGGGYAR